MADENDTTTISDAPASVVAAIDVPKKQRKPRAKKAAPETAPAEAAASTAAGKRYRQTKGRKAKPNGDENSAKSAAARRAPKAAQTATAAPTAVVEEMADLLQLEEENRKLRKLLAEKLRAENADLRKRLNLA